VLRLYAARASHDFDMQIFSDGDYVKAVEQKIASETISKVLYPSDAAVAGRELRLLQEYFLVACAVRDTIRRFEQHHENFREFPAKVAIQLNDTHPALTVAELMRILVDEKNLPWEEAWAITQASVAYTNHTLAPEALEQWPVPLLEYVVPRHLQLIYEINRRFLEQVARASPGETERLRRLSLIEESTPKQVRMVHVAIVGSHAVNGVSALHTELLKTSLVPDFYQLWPERFSNKTNGVTPRRWLLKANPPLAELLCATIGDGWITDLEQLRKLESWADDAGFRTEVRRIKRAHKARLARLMRDQLRVNADPDSLFDMQVKRMHLYKRQLLNVLHIIHDYLALIDEGRPPAGPRTYVFAGKAAPGYWAAKQIIKLIHNVGQVINHDRRARDWITVAFLPDYRVSLAEQIIPAADLSEHLSTAGTEASGTSQMKAALNGAVILGTWDGATVEIREDVGADNIFLFGLTVGEVQALRQPGAYRPWDYYARDRRVQCVVEALRSNMFCPQEPDLFTWIAHALLDAHDEYLHLADLPAYLEAHDQAGAAFCDQQRWTRMAILNIARMGRFSSDRAVKEYARDIWDLKSIEGTD